MKKAIVTLCIGEEWKQLASLTHPTIKNYADRINVDFLVINYPIFNIDPGFEKFQIGTLLEKSYDRIIFLDTDIIVRDFCPDLFELIPERDIGAFIESKYMIYSQNVDYRDVIIGIQNKLGWVGWSKDYVNTGVLVVSKRHKPIFDINHGQIAHLHEQTQLNYNIKKIGFWLKPIPRRFNCMDFVNPGNERFEAFIIHYAGKGYTDEWHNMNKKIDRIKTDLEIIEKEESL